MIETKRAAILSLVLWALMVVAAWSFSQSVKTTPLAVESGELLREIENLEESDRAENKQLEATNTGTEGSSSRETHRTPRRASLSQR